MTPTVPASPGRNTGSGALRLACTAVVVLAVLAIMAATVSAADPLSPAASKPSRDPLADLPSYGESLKRMVISLFTIIAALLVVAKVLPRLLGSPRVPGAGKVIQVVESHRLEPRKSIYLVRVADQYFLLGSTGDRLDTLAGGPIESEKVASALRRATEQATPAPKPARAFADLLKSRRPNDGHATPRA